MSSESPAVTAEPIAIVGMGCRLPGGINSPSELWDMLSSGRDATSRIPADRWAAYDQPGSAAALAMRDTTRSGAFLDEPAAFDAAFFGVTPREAEIMDPQQRLVLEATWEALEHAGIPPHALAGSDTGVFVGVGSDDYGRQMLEDLPRIEAWTGIGAAFCAVANRVSYLLDLRGPSLAVDTACSSSLVAMHLACQSLRVGETSVGIAAGVNLIAGPGLTMVLDLAGATSPDGRSKPFDSSANGYGRGEGAGVVVLKRLSDALRDGDRVVAVIRGSAVRQDGRTKGMMAPNGEAQAHVAREALRAAGLAAHEVDYVEAHGTGTRAGDPVEAGALSAVYGAGRPPESPCLIGSVKGNIGHLEAGAAVAGVIKAVLALEHAQIPPNALFENPNPSIPWDTNGLRVVDRLTPWPAQDGPRRAAVSSFGYGGTVGHLVLEQAPAARAQPAAEPASEAEVYVLSGASESAIAQYAGGLADWLSAPDADEISLADVRYTLGVRRSHLHYRAAVVAADRAALVSGLRSLESGDENGAVTTGAVTQGSHAPVWVFSGHGSQWLGMGKELLAEHQGFADTIDRIDSIFVAEMGFSPRAAIETSDYATVERIQPMIFAIQVALAEVWRGLGLRPAAVIGHSVGEIAAAVTAGVLTVEDGARLVCRRSLLLRAVAGKGAMAMLGLPFAEVVTRLADRADVVAAIESSSLSTVVAGPPAAVADMCEQWTAEGLMVRKVDSDVAFHSPQMDELLADLAAAAADLPVADPTVPLYTTALTDPRSTQRRDGKYWAANLRNPVRLGTAVSAAADDGYRVFLEVSPHPVVAHSVSETLSESGLSDTVVTGTLRRGKPEYDTLLANLSLLHCAGIPVDFAAAIPTRSVVTLPRIAWQHKQFWFTGSVGGGTERGHVVEAENLLGAPLSVAGAANLQVWQTKLEYDNRPYPGTHEIHGTEVLPAAILLTTFFEATERGSLADVSLKVPVSLAAPRHLQVIRQDDTVRLASRLAADEDTAWQTHTTAVAAADTDLEDPAYEVAQAWARCPDMLEPGAVLDRLHAVGVADKGFPWVVDELARGDRRVIAKIRSHPDSESGPAGWASVIDAVLTVVPLALPGDEVLRMPAHIGSVRFAAELEPVVTIDVRLVDTPAGDTVEVVVACEDGRVVGRFEGLRFSTLDGDAGAPVSPYRLVHVPTWSAVEIPAKKVPLGTVVSVGAGHRAAAFAEPMENAGGRFVSVAGTDEFAALAADLGPGDHVLVFAGDDPVQSAWSLARAAQLMAESGTHPARLWSVTEGQKEAVGAPGQTPVLGLGRIIAGEHPELWGGILDLDPAQPDTAADAVADVLGRRLGSDVYALRGGAVEAMRLTPMDLEPTRPAFECRADGTYLITGGLGVLGVAVAEWLVGKGARRIVLVGRSGVAPRSQWNDVDDPAALCRIEAVRKLEGMGATVKTIELDITDHAQAASLLDPDRLGLPPIRGVVHAAGVLNNKMVRNLDEASLRTVMAPKVQGALVLDELFPVGTLDFFVMFSSVGQLLGLTGQASYASANAYLDGLVRRRAAAGETGALSLAWTSWRGMGMAVSDVVDQELRDRGVGDIAPVEAFGAWDFAARRDCPFVPVLRITELDAGFEPLPILGELTFGQAAAEQTDRDETDLAALEPEELLAHLVTQVSAEICAEMKIDQDGIDIRRPLGEIGLDSVMTLSIRRRLEKRFRLALPATLLWNHPTVLGIAGYLASQLVPVVEAESVEPELAAVAG
ncbi:type I polyketide synthase [Actinokineospora xionganensis]|uniref:Acyltransferase domain-containing protein n=1 Tax=Actinokineospora xionganensis TaxID=2684470 RepID=A0ABR7L0C6_9PSEU|nr:type I polyketide synthase [Actinokineospora xionganensis]MBC6445973.1 acyltransferase domain-containing protein [Actinokineospora xionganensis]